MTKRAGKVRIGLAALLALALIWIAVPQTASATTNIDGSTQRTTTFYVQSYGSATVKLYSYKGSARVKNYTATGSFKSYETESHYGFYRVTVQGSGYSASYRWVPSANVLFGITDAKTSRTLELSFPRSGNYTVKVEPMSAGDISNFWIADRFDHWITDATWEVSKESNCNCSYSNPNPPSVTSDTVTVNCYDENGSFLKTYTETVTKSTTLYPKSISGYTATSNSYYVSFSSASGASTKNISFYYRKNRAQEVSIYVYCYDENGHNFNTYIEKISSSCTIYPENFPGYTAVSSWQDVTYFSSSGTCSPSSISFYYKRNREPAPGPDDKAVIAGQDTQFRTGVSDNHMENNLYKLFDDNSATNVHYVLWGGERDDSIPEFTLTFNNETVSAIGLRNGNQNDFYSYARVRILRARVYHSGGVTEKVFSVPDGLDYGYQRFNLDRTLSGVYKIELYIGGTHDGQGGNRYVVYITDICFFR